jgi:hypothetical protein
MAEENLPAIDYSTYTEGQQIGSFRIEAIMIKQKDYIVYLDDKVNIQYLDAPNFSRPTHFSRIYQAVNEVEMMADLVFRKDKSDKKLRQYKENIAQALVEVLLNDKDIDIARRHLKMVGIKIKAEGIERIRMAYLLTAFTFTAFVLVSLLAVWILRSFFVVLLHSEQIYNLLVASLTGGIGGFISCFIRFRNYRGNIFAGTRMHMFDGFFRIFYGLVAGFIASLAVKANVVGGFLGGSAVSLVFVAAVAGASEFFVPSLVAKMDSSFISESDDNKGIDKKDRH